MALYIVASNYSSSHYKIERTKVSRNELRAELRNKTIHYYKITDDEVLAHEYIKQLAQTKRINNEDVYEYPLNNLTMICNRAIEEVQKRDYMDVDCVGGFPFLREDAESPKKYCCPKCPKKFSYFGQAEDHLKLEHYEVTKDDMTVNNLRVDTTPSSYSAFGIGRNMGMNITPSHTPLNKLPPNSMFKNSIFKV